MERKVCLADGLKLSDDGAGWLEGYGSTFGNLDEQRDIVVQGAFAESLPDFLRDGFMPVGHDWGALAVATIDHAAEDDHGLHLRAQFHTTPAAQAARTVVRERLERGKSVGLSIGFRLAPDGSERRDDGVRLITKAQLFEVSIVTVPANALATVTAIKAGDGLTLADESGQVLAACQDLSARLRSHAELRTVKEGRVLSEANRGRLKTHADALEGIVGDLRALHAATAPPDDGKAALLAVVIRAQRTLARLNGVAV